MMLSRRSYQKELLDGDNIPFEDIRQNMKELDFINKWLGGHAITVKAFKELAAGKKDLTVCEIGCGGGDNLLAIQRYCLQQGITLQLTGIDIKQECIDYAKRRNTWTKNATWITNDFENVYFPTKPDIIFSSLFCHHFTNPQLITQLKWMNENSSIGFFINDLHRHWLAYYSIRLLTKIFSSSYLVKNDAPLSVARGFTRKELEELCMQAGLKECSIHWRWAFRFVILHQHG